MFVSVKYAPRLSAVLGFAVISLLLTFLLSLPATAEQRPAAQHHAAQHHKEQKQRAFFSRTGSDKSGRSPYFEPYREAAPRTKRAKPAVSDSVQTAPATKPEQQIKLNLAGGSLPYIYATNLPDLLVEASAPIPPITAGWDSLLQSRSSQAASTYFMCARLAPSPFRDAAAIYAEKEIIAALTRYYTRSPTPIWSDSQGRLYPRSKRIADYLAQASEDGLNPADYLPPLPCSQTDTGAMRDCETAADGSNIELIEFDFALSAGLLRYISDMQNGRVKARAFTGYYNLPAKKIDLDALLLQLSQSSTPTDILAAAKPQVSAYAALRAELAALNNNGIDAQTDKKPANTAISAEKQRKQLSVLASMERLRWLPRNFPPAEQDYVFINVPAMQAQFFSNGQEKLSMKAVVGSPSNPTNSFYSTVERVVFNPSWGVPYSILKNEMASRIARDPSYPARGGYEVYYKGKQVNPEAINWAEVAQSGGVNIRQKPGSNNALGRLKILFPNPYNIYMHDTPSKSAFARANRAVSHGCVRLAQPEAMAAAVLQNDPKALTPYFKRSENSILPPRPVNVYLTYFTAWQQIAPQNASEKNNIRYYGDIYTLDMPLQQAETALTNIRAQYRFAEQTERQKRRKNRQAVRQAAADQKISTAL